MIPVLGKQTDHLQGFKTSLSKFMTVVELGETHPHPHLKIKSRINRLKLKIASKALCSSGLRKTYLLELMLKITFMCPRV